MLQCYYSVGTTGVMEPVFYYIVWLACKGTLFLKQTAKGSFTNFMNELRTNIEC